MGRHFFRKTWKQCVRNILIDAKIGKHHQHEQTMNSITLVFLDSLLLSIFLRPTRLHTLLISSPAQMQSQPPIQNSQGCQHVSDKHILKHPKSFSLLVPTAPSLRGRQNQILTADAVAKTMQGGWIWLQVGLCLCMKLESRVAEVARSLL